MLVNGLLIIVGILLLINLLAPLLIWKLQMLPARVSLQPVEEAQFLARQSGEFRVLDGALRAMGCDYLASSSLLLENVTTSFSLYLFDAGYTIVTLVAMKAPNREVVYVEFSRLYEDGSLLCVNNSPVASAYPDMAVKIMARVPEHNRPESLYQVFKRLVASLHNSAPAANAAELDCFRVIEDFMHRESDELARRGYCRPEMDAGGFRRVTLKGAYLMTWGQLFPGSWLKKHRDARYAKRLLQAT